jgi:hypothetical protein
MLADARLLSSHDTPQDFCSATSGWEVRIASPEMLSKMKSLPHLICSFWTAEGKGGHEAREHGDTR